MVLVVYVGDGAEATTRVIELPDGAQLTIGRARTSAIPIASERVSRNHARIVRLGHRLSVEDLGSCNGTWIDGSAVSGTRQLASGDAIVIGPAMIVVSVTTRAVARPRIHSIRTLEERLAAEVERGQTYRRVFSLVRLRFGGSMADIAGAICRVAAITRRMDLVAEYSHSELAIVLPEIDATAAAENARAFAAAARSRRGTMVPALDVRVGVAGFPQHGTTPAALIARAGAAVEAVRLAAADRVGIPPPDEQEAGIIAPIVGDPQMRRVYELVRRVAAHPITVLVCGETGAGKEVIAAAIHGASDRRAGPLVRLNCASLPESLLESALFGHERGAFTGADRQMVGYFEAANGGTLFLDEIGEISAATQAKLLRVLDEHRVTRVGGTEAIDVDVRVVCATNRDLEAEAGRGMFRRDLFFRIGAFTILVPPLRDRRGEIVPLAELFLAKCHAATEQRHRVPILSPAAAEALQRYEWPGNVRELRNTIERAYVVHDSGVIEIDDLPERIVEAVSTAVASATFELDGRHDVRDHVAEIEREVIVTALAACDGSQKEAAKKLGLTRRALIYRMEKHGLKPLPACRTFSIKVAPT